MTRKEQTLQAADEYIRERLEEGCGRTGDTFPAFIEGAEWADQTFIDKACQWFKCLDDSETVYNTTEDFINAFRKVMGE